ncbi:hypothetical protein BDP81DRAFT_310945, partial [Colletotrichum phormii]
LAEKPDRSVLALCVLNTCSVFSYLLAGMTAKYGILDRKAGIYGTITCIFIFLGACAFGLTPLTAMYAPEDLSYGMRAE